MLSCDRAAPRFRTSKHGAFATLQRQLLDKPNLRDAPELKRVDDIAHLSAQLDAAMSMWTYYRERSEQEFRLRSALDEKLRELEERCRHLQSQIQAMRKQIQAKRKQIQAKRKQIQAMRKQIQAMRNSRSWRLTAPYRKLGGLCRRLASLVRRLWRG